MKILIQYLKPYTPLIALTLLLAAINQVFSMMDPWILGIIIDKLLDHHRDFEANAFTIQVLKYIGLAIGAAMVSRIAKNFQDYFLNTITLKLGAQIYT
ncbi:MAG: ABC transporter ATP-binding protein, partial [Bacteroidota bacterium]